MGRWTAERWAASSGMLFAVLVIVSAFIAGSPPHYNASADKIASYFGDHHRALVVSGILGGIAVLLWLWFLASYAGMHRDAGQGRLSTIMYGAGVAGVALAAVGGAIMLCLTQLTTLDQNTAVGLYGLSSYFYTEMFWALAALALASYFSISRSHSMPDWYGWLSLVGGVLFVLGGLSVRQHGFFSPSGTMCLIAFLGFAVWAFVGSWLCAQKHAVHSHSMSPAHSH